MTTPSGNSPLSSASTQRSGRNNKRKLEDYPPNSEQFFHLKHGFLNSHARICDICKKLIYGSSEAPQSDYTYDSNSNSLTESQVGDMILGHLDAIYRKVIKDLSSDYGYNEGDATAAVLATAICYGCKDPIGNALKHALTFLKCGMRVDKPEMQSFSEELKTLVRFVLMIVYDAQKKKYPVLCLDDFLLWLLIYKTDPSDASKMASYSFGTFGNLEISSCSTCLRWEEESTSNSSILPFMPVAGLTADDNLDASSPHPQNASESELIAETGILGLVPTARITATRSQSPPNSNPNAVKKNIPMSSADYLVDKFSSLTISGSSIPEEKPVYADSKHADSSKRGFTRHRRERRCQAGLMRKERKFVTLTNQELESTKSTMLDSNCSLPRPDEIFGMEASESFANVNFSFASFASSSFRINTANISASTLSHAANVDAFTAIPSKSCSDVSFKPCEIFFLELLLSRRKDELQYWTNWAHHKVLDAKNKLNNIKADLHSLRQEKLEAKKEQEAFAESTIKKIREMDKALAWSRTQVKMASAAICRLEREKIRLKEMQEAAKVRASESAAKSQEALSKEIMAPKKAQACERERTLCQEELVSSKPLLSQLQKQLQQAQVSQGQMEDKLKQEERLKSEELTTALNERIQHEQLEASVKSNEDMIKLENERDLQGFIDHIRILQYHIAEIKLMVCSTNFASLDWAQSAYFTIDKMGSKESGSRVIQRAWECVMCLTEKISVVFLPCAHLVLCKECNEMHKMQGLGDCPSCRTPIKQRICIHSS